MLEYTVDFKQPQLILLVYNLVKALAKLTILKYFQKDLRPLILAKLQNKYLELKSFFQLIKEAVIAKTKIYL